MTILDDVAQKVSHEVANLAFFPIKSNSVFPNISNPMWLCCTDVPERKYCNIVLSMLEECGKGSGQDAKSFNIAIAACSRANQWEKAMCGGEWGNGCVLGFHMGMDQYLLIPFLVG